MKRKISALLIIASVFVLSTACAPQYSGKVPPKIINGEIDLTGWDFAKDGPVNLDGDWLFAWENLFTRPQANIKPGVDCEINVKNGLSNTVCHGTMINTPLLSEFLNGKLGKTVSIPHAWKKDSNYRAMGYGVYAMRISGLPGNDGTKLALQRLRNTLALSAWNLWLKNGDTVSLIGSAGKVAQQESLEQLRALPLNSVFLPKNSTKTSWLLLETSNFSFRTGGLRMPPVLLTERQAREKNNSLWATELLASGILLFAGIYQLLIYSLRRKDYAPFLLGLICLLAALRVLLTSRIYEILFPGINSHYTFKFEYLTLTGWSVLFPIFCYHLMQKKASLPALKAVVTLASLVSFLILFTKANVYTTYLSFLQFVAACSLSFAVYALLKNIRSEQSILRSNARLALSFFSFYVLAAIHDVLKYQLLWVTPDLLGFSNIIFLIGMGYILAKQNAGMRKKSEALSKTLKSELQDKIEIARDLEEQAGRVQRLTQLSLTVQRASSFDDMLENLALVLKQNFQVESFLVYIVTEDQSALVPYRFHLKTKLPPEVFASLLGTELSIGTGKGLHENVVLRKKPVYLKKIPAWTSTVPEEDENRRLMGMNALFALPLIMKDNVFAVITMNDVKPEYRTNPELSPIKDLTKSQRKQMEELLGLVSASLYLTLQDVRLAHSEQKLNAEEINRKLIESGLQGLEARQKALQKELKEASNQLIQAEKLSGLGAMVSGIAHDINNPLNFIETARFQEQEKLDQLKEHLLGLVPEGEEGEEFKADLLARFDKLGKLNDQIKTGVTRVTEISKSMRNASRADTEKTNDVNLVEVIQESLIITGNKVNQFQLINNIPDGIALATCNRSQIGQVVMNFLSNAADALVEYKEQNKEHKGTIQVDLSISNHSDGQNKDQNQQKTVQISISDNGSGVPQENRDKVLNAFFTTKAAGVGTGLGLAICGKIAQAHDGTIYIEDGLPNDQGGYGARFTLEFEG